MHHINQLRAVVALAEYRNFSRAAESINVTQSALSQNIKKLEEFYGAQLFERRHGRVDLTAYGELVVCTATQMVESINNLTTEVSRLRDFEVGRLSIGVDPYLASSIAGPVLARLLDEQPKLKFTVRSGHYKFFEKELRESRCDLFLGYEPVHVPPDLEIESLTLPTPLIVCAPAHPLLEKHEVSLSEAILYPIVTPPPPPWYVEWAKKQLGQAQDDWPIEQMMVLDADNITMIKTIAKNSLAITAALPTDLTSELADGLLKKLNIARWPQIMPGCIVTKIGKPRLPAEQLFNRALAHQLDLELGLRLGS